MRKNAWILKVVSLALVMVLTVGFLPPMQILAADIENDDENLGVSNVATSGITLSNSSIELGVGQTHNLTYTLLPEGVEPFDVEWLTSDATVATVENGVVTAKATGTAEISVRSVDNLNLVAVCRIDVVATNTVALAAALENIVTVSIANGVKTESYYSDPYTQVWRVVDSDNAVLADNIMPLSQTTLILTGSGTKKINISSSFRTADNTHTFSKVIFDNITVTGGEGAPDTGNYAVRISAPFLELNGNNKISADDNKPCLSSNGTVITGSGLLELTTYDEDENFGGCNGISGSVTITDNANVDINSLDHGIIGSSVAISGNSKVNINSKRSDGIYTQNGTNAGATISENASVTINAKGSGICIAFNGSLNISGGNIQISAYDGLYSSSSDIDISGGAINIQADFYAISNYSGNTYISGGLLYVEGISNTNGNLIISGGWIETNNNFTGISADSVTIRGNKTYVKAGNNGDSFSYAVSISNLTVQNGAILELEKPIYSTNLKKIFNDCYIIGAGAIAQDIDGYYDINGVRQKIPDGFNPSDRFPGFPIGSVLGIIFSEPSNTQSDVAIDRTIKFTFNKEIVADTSKIFLKAFNTDAIVPASISVSKGFFGMSYLTITPSNDLGYGTKYYVEILSDAIHDSNNDYYTGMSKGQYQFTTKSYSDYDSNKIYQYLLNKDTDRLFGGYDFALFYVNDISAWDAFLYGVDNTNDVLTAIITGISTKGSIADAYMDAPHKTEAILREIINELCRNPDAKWFPPSSKEGISFAYALLNSQLKDTGGGEAGNILDLIVKEFFGDNVKDFIMNIFKGEAEFEKWVTDYSQNIVILESIKSAVPSNTYLHKITNELLVAYREPIVGSIRDWSIDKLQSFPVDFVKAVLKDVFSLKPNVLLTTALDFALSFNSTISGMDKVISLNTIQDESIQAFKEVSQKIKTGNYTDDDIEAYTHLFNLCRSLKLMQYKEMQKNYKYDSQESMYLQSQIDSLQNMSYDKFTYATPFVKPPKEKRFFGIFCPVDVDIYNSNGVILAQFINDTPTYLNGGENELIVFSKGDEKFIIADSDAELVFNLTATNSGVMDFNVRDFMVLSDGDIDSKTFNNITLQSGKKMTVKTTEGINASEIRLYITDENGMPVAEVATDGTEIPINNNNSSENSSKKSSGSTSSLTANTTVDPLANLNVKIKVAVESAAKSTPAGQSVKATVQIKNASKITLTMLKQAADTAKKAGGNVTLHFDAMSEDGKTVLTRIYVKPELATRDIILSANEVRAKSIKTLFEKYFNNKIAVVSFDQQGSFGMPVEVATKVDLTGMDTKNLIFYSYSKETNSYTRIKQPEYRIDKNGYLHFVTELAGDIIISENSLARK